MVEAINNNTKKSKRKNSMTSIWWYIKNNKMLIISIILVSFLVFCIVFAPLLTSQDPDEVNMPNRLKWPGTEGHLLGTDGFGRDLFARILYGGRTSLGLSLIIVGVNSVIGLIIGSISAYVGGFVDGFIMRIIDILMAIPGMILSLFILGVFGSTPQNLFISLIFIWLDRICQNVKELSFKPKRADIYSIFKGDRL